MPNQENQRVRLTKKLLQNSLMEMLETESIHRISIKSLCAQAGVNRSTFYKYYGSQYDLLREIEEETAGKVFAILESRQGDRASALADICRYFEVNDRSIRLLLNNSEDSAFVRRILTAPAIRQEILQAIAPYYSEGQQDYVFDFVTLGSARILWRWINRRDREPSGEIAALLTRLMGLA